MVGTIIWIVALAIVFVIAWRAGYITRLRDYVMETRAELEKCAWPSWDELKGSTVLVTIAIVALGAFTFAVDSVCVYLVQLIT